MCIVKALREENLWLNFLKVRPNVQLTFLAANYYFLNSN